VGRFEKILLVILLVFCVVFLALGHRGGLFVSLRLLTLTYAGGAYWLFRRSPHPAAWVRMLAGLCFAVLLYGMPDSIGLHRT
jgi:hypothetical protein